MPGTSPVDISCRKNRVEVRLVSPGSKDDDELLAWCMIGDDENLERIADLLSSKRLPAEAMKLRQMAMDARRVPGKAKEVKLRG